MLCGFCFVLFNVLWEAHSDISLTSQYFFSLSCSMQESNFKEISFLYILMEALQYLDEKDFKTFLAESLLQSWHLAWFNRKVDLKVHSYLSMIEKKGTKKKLHGVNFNVRILHRNILRAFKWLHKKVFKSNQYLSIMDYKKLYCTYVNWHDIINLVCYTFLFTNKILLYTEKITLETGALDQKSGSPIYCLWNMSKWQPLCVSLLSIL